VNTNSPTETKKPTICSKESKVLVNCSEMPLLNHTSMRIKNIGSDINLIPDTSNLGIFIAAFSEII
jgi:hypothetical protein